MHPVANGHDVLRAAVHRALVGSILTARWLLLLGLMLVASRADAQDTFKAIKDRLQESVQKLTVPNSLFTDGPQVRAAFEEVVAQPRLWTVRIKCDGEDVALGSIIDSAGWIVTKASQLEGKPVCRLYDDRQLEAQLIGTRDDFDLALLKIDAEELPAANLNDHHRAEVGQWVATPGLGEKPVAVGVVSVAPRSIPKRSGLLGVQLDQAEKGPRITKVMPNSGAEAAGLFVNDIVTHVNGRATKTQRALVLTVRRYGPGDEIELTLLRGGKTVKRKATLSRSVKGIRPGRREIQDNMGGQLSDRRHGFPSVLQHDTVLRPIDCGGAIVNLDGELVGINVARAGRTESYAVPTEIVLTLLPQLSAGKLSIPTVVNPAGRPPEPPADADRIDNAVGLPPEPPADADTPPQPGPPEPAADAQ